MIFVYSNFVVQLGADQREAGPTASGALPFRRRGGIKSWSVAQHLLIAGAKQSLRIPFARETMKSIKESVHQLLEDEINLAWAPAALRGPEG